MAAAARRHRIIVARADSSRRVGKKKACVSFLPHRSHGEPGPALPSASAPSNSARQVRRPGRLLPHRQSPPPCRLQDLNPCSNRRSAASPRTCRKRLRRRGSSSRCTCPLQSSEAGASVPRSHPPPRPVEPEVRRRMTRWPPVLVAGQVVFISQERFWDRTCSALCRTLLRSVRSRSVVTGGAFGRLSPVAWSSSCAGWERNRFEPMLR